MGQKTLADILAGPEVTAHFNSLVETKIEELDLVPRSEAEALGQATVRQQNTQRALAKRARELIEAAKLPASFAADLLTRFGVEDQDDGDLEVGRDLALIEAVKEGDEVKKTAREVLEAAVDTAIKAERRKLTEAAPTVPYAPPAGGDGDGAGAGASFGGDGSQWGQYAREHGIDTGLFGGTTSKPKTPATT